MEWLDGLQGRTVVQARARDLPDAPVLVSEEAFVDNSIYFPMYQEIRNMGDVGPTEFTWVPQAKKDRYMRVFFPDWGNTALLNDFRQAVWNEFILNRSDDEVAPVMDITKAYYLNDEVRIVKTTMSFSTSQEFEFFLEDGSGYYLVEPSPYVFSLLDLRSKPLQMADVADVMIRDMMVSLEAGAHTPYDLLKEV